MDDAVEQAQSRDVVEGHSGRASDKHKGEVTGQAAVRVRVNFRGNSKYPPLFGGRDSHHRDLSSRRVETHTHTYIYIYIYMHARGHTDAGGILGTTYHEDSNLTDLVSPWISSSVDGAYLS